MSIKRRKDTGHWLVRVQLHGRRRSRTLPADTQRGVLKAVERKLYRELEGTATVQRRCPAFGSLAARYWQEHGKHLRWADTLKGHLNALSDELGDATPADEITAERVSRAFSRYRGTVSDSTLNRRLAVLRNLHNRAESLWGLDLPRIPWKLLKLKEPEPQERYIHKSDRLRLIAECPLHVRRAVLIALLTGLRRGAVLSLYWENTDLERGIIYAVGKGAKRNTVPITPALQQILCEIGPQKSGPVISWKGKPVQSIKTAFNKAKRRAKLPHVTFHQLRHSVAQDMIDAGVALDVVQATLHHTDPRTTRRYAHAQVIHIADALKKAQGS